MTTPVFLAVLAGALMHASWNALVKVGRLKLRVEGMTPSELNARLVESGVAVGSLVPTERNLEELFLSLTSKEIT